MSLTVNNASEEDNWRDMAFRNRMRAEKAEAERDELQRRIDAALPHLEHILDARVGHVREAPDDE